MLTYYRGMRSHHYHCLAQYNKKAPLALSPDNTSIALGLALFCCLFCHSTEHFHLNSNWSGKVIRALGPHLGKAMPYRWAIPA